MTSDVRVSDEVDLTDTDTMTQRGCGLLRAQLNPGCHLQLIKPLTGGRSGAQVWLCDISAPGVASPEIDGQYVLKIARRSGFAATSANLRAQDLGEYARLHVPRVVIAANDRDLAIELYDLAGGSLDTVRTAESISDHLDRDEVHRKLSAELLSAQLDTASVAYDTSAAQVLQQWLGVDWTEGRRGKRLRELSLRLNPHQDPVFPQGAELLPDPAVVMPDLLRDAPLDGTLNGTCHGDLHERNILVKGSRATSDLAYWLIDFNWDSPAPLLYDHAYLECSLVLDGLARMSSPALATVLARIDGVEPTAPVALDLSGSVLVHRIEMMREAATKELTERQANRVDVWTRQLALARLAAAINWSTKSGLSDGDARAAYIISAWHLRSWLRTHGADQWRTIASTTSAQRTGDRQILAEAEILRLWSVFQLRNTGRDLFLVAEPIEIETDVSPTAQCPWSAIIDLDPASDESGLASVVAPKLRARRHVSIYGTNVQSTNPRRATNWLMANGWNSHAEPSSTSREQWRRSYLRRVRDLVDLVHDDSPAASAAILILRSDTDETISSRIVEYIDEVYQAAPEVLTLSVGAGSASGGIDATEFFEVLRTTLVHTSHSGAATLPGANGPLEISREDLLRLEVDLEVLHSEKLTDASDVTGSSDEFWRGRPPKWGELDARIDLQRDAYPALHADLLDALDPPRLVQISIDHSPGAGGTTLGRRAAWDLHLTYPTLRLRNYTRSTAERIDEVFRQTGKPVVVLAEASVLQQSDRDELFDNLRRRATAAVVVRVSRTTQSEPASHRLSDPMSIAECHAFIDAYLARDLPAPARSRLAELRASLDGDLPIQHRSPFYIGLCAYDENFAGIDRYVDHHLSHLDDARRRVAVFLALVTRYAQFPIPADIVRRWLGAERPREVDMTVALNDVLGPDLRHLVVTTGGGARLLHPVVAERVLQSPLGGAQQGLAQIADSFIRALNEVLGSSSLVAREMLEKLFVRRAPVSGTGQRKRHFAEVVQAMPLEGGQLVFETLTDLYPQEPHFWNHRGRYHIYVVKGDFRQAESYLIHAVEHAGARASMHRHTLGMVRRFWIEDEIKRALASQSSIEPEELLAAIRPLYESAMEAFAKCRPEMSADHGLVTPLQLIHYVIGALVSASGQPGLTALLASGSLTADWIAEQLDEAEALLDDLRAASLDGRSRHDFYDRLTADFDVLYGDIEALIQQWRAIKTERGMQSGDLGLVLARTIFAQTGRDWSDVPVARAREISEMLWDAVSDGTSSDSDLRLWLQAYRQLPDFSETTALERLSAFAESGSVDAYYYLYVMNFMIWLRGDAQTQDRIRQYLERCRQLSRNQNRSWSFEWIGIGEPAPLVHFTELGSRLPGPDAFFARPYLLGRVRGVIEQIDGRQSGHIRVMPGTLTAHFVPRSKFLQSRDINASVDFFLGFSYDGLRAWEVEYPGQYRGPKAPTAFQSAEAGTVGGGRRLDDPAPDGDRFEVGTDEDTASTAQPQVATAAPRPRGATLDIEATRGAVGARTGDDAYRAAIDDLLTQGESDRVPLDLLRLGETLQALFGHASYAQFKGSGKLRAAIERLGFEADQRSAAFYVVRRVHDE